MNVKKLIIAFVVVFIVLELTNLLVHNVILSSTYAKEEISKVFRPESEIQAKMWIGLVVDIIWSFFFVFIFVKGYENKGWLEGLRYGIYIGLFISLPAAYYQFMVYPLPYYLTFQWFIYGLIQYVILGIITALIYKSKEKPAETTTA